MAEFTIEQMLRTGHVKRWQIVRTAREQTIAEHMYRVWVISKFILGAINSPSLLGIITLEWALMHDVPEVVTGDIATPAKAAMRAAVPEGDPIRTIELSLSDEYRMLWENSKKHWMEGYPTPYEIVKLADLTEAYAFITCEGIGHHGRAVMQGAFSAMYAQLDVMRNKYQTIDWMEVASLMDRSAKT